MTAPPSAPRPTEAEPVHPRPASPAPPPPGKRSDLPLRLVTASVLVPGLLYLIAVGGIPYLATVVVLILLGTREFYQMIEAKGAQPIAGFGMAAAAALPIVAYLGNEYHATILMTAALLAVMVGQLTKAQIGEALASISGTFFGVFYVGWLLSHAVVLRFFHDVIGAKWGSEAAALVDPNAGAFYMVFTAACVVLTDAGAYFAGRAYGRRKLAPKISPSKTVEGAAGGVVVGTLGGLAFKALFDVAWPALSAGFEWSAAFLFAATLSVVGTIGDLVESLLKRDAQTKDTGTLLPGMGGILDRIDSSLLAIPVMYYMLLAYVYLRVG